MKKIISYCIILIMNTTKISNEEMLEATIKYVSQYGLENVTTKKIAVTMGISEGTILNRYKNKKALLIECLYYIDKQIDSAIGKSKISILNLPESIKKLWYKYFKFLVNNASYSKYYRSFRHSSYYDEDVIKGQDKSFSLFVTLIKKNCNCSELH